jgi:hypothetical protein
VRSRCARGKREEAEEAFGPRCRQVARWTLTHQANWKEDRDQAKLLVYRAAMRAFRRSPTYRFRHHHAFPSLTMGMTDAMSYLHVVVPTSPTTSRSMVRAFVYKGDRGVLAGRVLSGLSDASIQSFIG